MAGFVSRIAEINQAAEQSPGFVWRYTGTPSREDLEPLRGYVEPLDPQKLLFNVSVWDSIEALREFVYRSAHRELFGGKKQWFTPLERPYQALWWIPDGEIPTLEEAIRHLRSVDEQGPTGFAFTFQKTFPAE